MISIASVVKSELYKTCRFKLLPVSTFTPFLLIGITSIMLIANYEEFMSSGFNLQKYFSDYILSILSLISIIFVAFIHYKIDIIDIESGMNELMETLPYSSFYKYLGKYILVEFYVFIFLLSAFTFLYFAIFTMDLFMPELALADYNILKIVLIYFGKLLFVLQPIILLQFLLSFMKRNIFLNLGIPILSAFLSFIIINNSRYSATFIYNFTFMVYDDFSKEIITLDDYIFNVLIYQVILLTILFALFKWRKIK